MIPFAMIQSVSCLAFFLAFAVAKSPAEPKGKKTVIVGTIQAIDPSGQRFEIRLEDRSIQSIHLDSSSKVYFVGFLETTEKKPKNGYGVKATCDPSGLVTTVSFTPPVGQPSMLGERRLSMPEQELFRQVDRDRSQSISYVEFSQYVYFSAKHGPDSFRKADIDGDGVLNLTEFISALAKVSWWRLSRKTPDDWFLEADKNHDRGLDVEEFKHICPSGNHVDNIFKRSDEDDSGYLSAEEITAYIRDVTHGKKKDTRQKKDTPRKSKVNEEGGSLPCR